MENDRLIKDVAIDAAGQYAKALAARDDFATLCKQNGEIAFDVLKASVNLSAEAPDFCCWPTPIFGSA
jgi:hypothetical protein